MLNMCNDLLRLPSWKALEIVMEFYYQVFVGTLFILYASVEWNTDTDSNCLRLLDLLGALQS